MLSSLILFADVKPSNMLLDEKGTVKLCDFGISGRLVDSKARTRVAGCTAYMAVSFRKTITICRLAAVLTCFSGEGTVGGQRVIHLIVHI